MTKVQERFEREARADRLKTARKLAGYSGPTPVANAIGINVNVYKAHEQGRNGFGITDAKSYSGAFKVSLKWLYFGEGEPNDRDEPVVAASVPLISWISAGELSEQITVMDFADYPTTQTAGLGKGEWIALRVDGPSMNKISPPDSIIFVDTTDQELIKNGLYVIADETGQATYKRFDPDLAPPFQPASYKDIEAPALQGAIKIIGRVRRSVIDM